VSGVSIALLTGRLRAQLDSKGATWLDEALAAVESEARAVRTWFPAAARKVGGASLDVRDHDAGAPWSANEAARALLLDALGDRVNEEIDDLYRYGDAAERRAILRSLHLLRVGDAGTALVIDALRTNDERLVAASLGPYAMENLDDNSLRHGVLKCVFMGLPLAGIPELDSRADAELARMLASYAHERVAAGRDVPADVWPLIDRFPPEAELAALADELHANADGRRRAAAAALAQHAATRGRS
jgi:hypothetical protein